jgi:hypothetical protein
VLADRLNERELDCTVVLDGVDGPIGSAEPDRAIARPFTSEWFIMVARLLPCDFQADRLHASYPSHELSNDVSWAIAKVLSCARGENNDSCHLDKLAKTASLSTFKVAQGTRIPN